MYPVLCVHEKFQNGPPQPFSNLPVPPLSGKKLSGHSQTKDTPDGESLNSGLTSGAVVFTVPLTPDSWLAEPCLVPTSLCSALLRKAVGLEQTFQLARPAFPVWFVATSNEIEKYLPFSHLGSSVGSFL